MTSDTCKYGHLKLGDNLLLRPRLVKHRISWVNKDGTKRSKIYEYEVTERVCVTCLNEQRQRYRDRHRFDKQKGYSKLDTPTTKKKMKEDA